MLLAPGQLPRAVFASEFPKQLILSVVRMQTSLEIVRVPHVEFSRWISENIDPKHVLAVVCVAPAMWQEALLLLRFGQYEQPRMRLTLF